MEGFLVVLRWDRSNEFLAQFLASRPEGGQAIRNDPNIPAGSAPGKAFARLPFAFV